MSSRATSRRPSPDWLALIREAFEQANYQVYQEAANWAGRAGMGTTLTGVIIAGDVMYLGHIGDSRAYLIRNGQTLQLTHDHTWVAKRVREGRMSEHEAQTSDRRGQLTDAIGLAAMVHAEIDAIALRPGDRILLCTDGLTETLSDAEILSITGSGKDMQRTAARLAAAANRAGGHDNCAVVVIDCRGAVERRHAPMPGRRSRKRPPPWAVAALTIVAALLLADGVYVFSHYLGGARPAGAQIAPRPRSASTAGPLWELAPPAEDTEVNSEMLDLGGRTVEVGP